MNSYMVSVFVQYQENCWWVDVVLIGGYFDYDDLKCKFVLGGGECSEKGDINGYLWVFSVCLGYDIVQQVDSFWYLLLFVSVDYVWVEVDGYFEKGVSVIVFDYDDQKCSLKCLGVGL